MQVIRLLCAQVYHVLPCIWSLQSCTLQAGWLSEVQQSRLGQRLDCVLSQSRRATLRFTASARPVLCQWQGIPDRTDLDDPVLDLLAESYD